MYQSLIEYWSKKKNIIFWKKKPTNILKKIKENRYAWFSDGELNIYNNCIEKNLEKSSSKTAAIFVDQNQKRLVL